MTRKLIPPLVANFSKYLSSPQTIALGGSYLTILSLFPTHPTNAPFPFPFPLPRPPFPRISISLLAMRLTPSLLFSPHPALFGTSPHPTVSSRYNLSTTHFLNLPLTLSLSLSMPRLARQRRCDLAASVHHAALQERGKTQPSKEVVLQSNPEQHAGEDALRVLAAGQVELRITEKRSWREAARIALARWSRALCRRGSVDRVRRRWVVWGSC